MKEKMKQEATDVVEVAPSPSPNKPAALAQQMQDRMMWGVKRGVSPKDTETLKALRGMTRKQRRAYLSTAGKRVRVKPGESK